MISCCHAGCLSLCFNGFNAHDQGEQGGIFFSLIHLCFGKFIQLFINCRDLLYNSWCFFSLTDDTHGTVTLVCFFLFCFLHHFHQARQFKIMATLSQIFGAQRSEWEWNTMKWMSFSLFYYFISTSNKIWIFAITDSLKLKRKTIRIIHEMRRKHTQLLTFPFNNHRIVYNVHTVFIYIDVNPVFNRSS